MDRGNIDRKLDREESENELVKYEEKRGRGERKRK